MPRNKTFDHAVAAVGDTPMIKINRLIPEDHATVFAKCEFYSPLNSVKDRIGSAMIEAGERGIALAFVCAAKGYKLTLTMPDSMSVERRTLLRQLGANLVLTPAAEGIPGSIRRATEIVESDPNGWMPQQFENPANPAMHEATTGPEIWADSGQQIDAMVAGVGTGGTITGSSRFLKKMNPDFKAYAVEPSTSPVISGGEPGKHKIQGIGAGFVPKNLDTSIIDEVITVSSEEAFEWGKKLALHEGIVAGISSGANLCAAAKIAARPEMKGKRIVTIMCSLGERYLSTPLFAEEA